MRSFLLAAALILGSAAAGWADNINVGLLYFSDNSNGTVSFGLLNMTGPSVDVTDGFPVSSDLDFSGIQLTLYCASSCGFGGPGDSTTLSSFEDLTSDLSVGGANLWAPLDASDTFSMAVLTLTFSTTNLTVDNTSGPSTSFTGSISASTTLTHSGGGPLADLDSVAVVDPAVPSSTTVPEPGALCLLAGGISGLFFLRRFNKQN